MKVHTMVGTEIEITLDRVISLITSSDSNNILIDTFVEEYLGYLKDVLIDIPGLISGIAYTAYRDVFWKFIENIRNNPEDELSLKCAKTILGTITLREFSLSKNDINLHLYDIIHNNYAHINDGNSKTSLGSWQESVRCGHISFR